MEANLSVSKQFYKRSRCVQIAKPLFAKVLVVICTRALFTQYEQTQK